MASKKSSDINLIETWVPHLILFTGTLQFQNIMECQTSEEPCRTSKPITSFSQRPGKKKKVTFQASHLISGGTELKTQLFSSFHQVIFPLHRVMKIKLNYVQLKNYSPWFKSLLSKSIRLNNVFMPKIITTQISKNAVAFWNPLFPWSFRKSGLYNIEQILCALRVLKENDCYWCRP